MTKGELNETNPWVVRYFCVADLLGHGSPSFTFSIIKVRYYDPRALAESTTGTTIHPMSKQSLVLVVSVVALITLSPSPALHQTQSDAENESGRTTNVQENLPSTPISDGRTLRELGEPNIEQETSDAKKQPQRFWERAFGPDTWSQWALVIFAGVAAGFAYMAFAATRRQANATEQMLLLTHRPKIIIRNVVIPELLITNRDTPMNQLTDTFEGYYYVANVGGQPATIRRTTEAIMTGPDLPMERPDKNLSERSISITLAPGESRKVSLDETTLPTQDVCLLINAEINAYLLLLIEYTDTTGTVRHTSACRKFDPASKCFVKVDNPDYEYTD